MGRSDSSGGSSSSDDGERRKEKKRKHTSKKHKKEKHSKKHKKDTEKDMVRAAKRLLKEHKHAEEKLQRDFPGLAPESNEALVKQQLTDSDYFLKHAEFTTWLLEAKRRYFTELTAEDAREQFQEFIQQWNLGRLPAKYYGGVVEAPAARTTYKWSFAGQAPAHGSDSVGMNAFLEDSDDRKVALKEEYREDRRKWRAGQREQLDELLPKATGREAVLEKKAARREAARSRDDSPDAVRLPGGSLDVLGGGDSFAEARAREGKREQMRRHRGAAKVEEVQHRAAQYQAAEDAKMVQFRALLASGPITIPKRQ